MERLRCKACGSFGMVPLEVDEAEPAEEHLLGGEQESRFFTCHVCGDNWLSVKKVETEGTCEITFVHQMGMQPTLKRIASMTTSIVLKEDTVDEWNYYLGDDRVDERAWREQLDRRRGVLRAICTN
ncbi:MAG: hypothetical protein AAGI91_13110 [Bacteroidota bacterium]